MKSIFRIIVLLLLLTHLSSCFEQRWTRYHNKRYYVHKKHYFKWHTRRNGDW